MNCAQKRRPTYLYFCMDVSVDNFDETQPQPTFQKQALVLLSLS